MNRLALAWIDVSLAQDEEIERLRRENREIAERYMELGEAVVGLRAAFVDVLNDVLDAAEVKNHALRLIGARSGGDDV